jgi:hypothetical protein
VLPNGNYVVRQPGVGEHHRRRDLVQRDEGCTGAVNAANSLVGSAGGDEISNIAVPRSAEQQLRRQSARRGVTARCSTSARRRIATVPTGCVGERLVRE